MVVAFFFQDDGKWWTKTDVRFVKWEWGYAINDEQLKKYFPKKNTVIAGTNIIFET